MSHLHFQHLRQTRNIGDRACSPYDYFQWENATVSDLRENDTPNHRVGVYGGGKIFGGLSTYRGVRSGPELVNVAWGVSTVQSFPVSLRYSRSRKLVSLVGSRDWGHRDYDFAPCVSCMSSAFDRAYDPTHELVFYAHGGKTALQGISIPDNIPTQTNNRGTFEEAISFLASGKVVVSNSYHGVYWGLLLGRKVVCIPFSSKFTRFRFAPTFAEPRNWLERADEAVAHPQMLEVCRDATIEFKAKVDRLIAGSDESP